LARGTQGELYETGRLEGCSEVSKFQKMPLKEKVRHVSLAPSSLILVLEDNAVWYKGSCEGHHFPNDESKGSLTLFKLWNDKEKEEEIVDVASGHAFTLFVTKSGLVWATGNKFLDTIGQNSEAPIQLTLPKGKKALRVWACCGPDHPVAFLELLDEATGAKRLFSAGKSEKGMLA